MTLKNTHLQYVYDTVFAHSDRLKQLLFVYVQNVYKQRPQSKQNLETTFTGRQHSIPCERNKLRKQLNIGNNENMGCDNLSGPARGRAKTIIEDVFAT